MPDRFQGAPRVCPGSSRRPAAPGAASRSRARGAVTGRRIDVFIARRSPVAARHRGRGARSGVRGIRPCAGLDARAAARSAGPRIRAVRQGLRRGGRGRHRDRVAAVVPARAQRLRARRAARCGGSGAGTGVVLDRRAPARAQGRRCGCVEDSGGRRCGHVERVRAAGVAAVAVCACLCGAGAKLARAAAARRAGRGGVQHGPVGPPELRAVAGPLRAPRRWPVIAAAVRGRRAARAAVVRAAAGLERQGHPRHRPDQYVVPAAASRAAHT